MDELCLENVFEQFFQATLNYTNDEIREKNEAKINELIIYISADSSTVCSANPTILSKPSNTFVLIFFFIHASCSINDRRFG